MSLPALGRQALAEALGTAILVAGIVGSGIAAHELSPNDAGLQLLENTAATVGVLVAIILALGPVSGAHFNPVVTLGARLFGDITTRAACAYVGAQVIGGAVGAMAANLMFGLGVVNLSTHHRASGPHLFAEAVATFGLVLVIFSLVRSGRGHAAAYAVGAYIGGGYFFTSSTSVANPAVTLARTLSNTFAGIAPASAPGFITAQVIGAFAAVGCVVILYPRRAAATDPAFPMEVPA